MAIKHKGKQRIGVRYDMIFHADVLETYDTGGDGRIQELVEKARRNPGMMIRATIYAEPEYECDPEVILGERIVYAGEPA